MIMSKCLKMGIIVSDDMRRMGSYGSFCVNWSQKNCVCLKMI